MTLARKNKQFETEEFKIVVFVIDTVVDDAIEKIEENEYSVELLCMLILIFSITNESILITFALLI